MKRRFALTTCSVAALILTLSACSLPGSDDDPTATPEAGPTATSTESPLDPSPTATPTEVPTDTPTPTATATATSTATPTATATATSTPIPVIENPFDRAPQPDAVLDNFTIFYRGDFETSEDGLEQVEIFIQQFSPERYHVRAGSGVEIWVIDQDTYFRNPDGSVFQVQSAIDPVLVSPAAYLIQIPSPASVPRALQTGEDEIDGRPATRYSVDPDMIGRFGLSEIETVDDPLGEIDVWIDEELGFISRMLVTVEWSDEAGVHHSATIEYSVSDVGTTPDIEPPV